MRCYKAKSIAFAKKERAEFGTQMLTALRNMVAKYRLQSPAELLIA